MAVVARARFRRGVLLIAGLLSLVAALAYLRDPPWLIDLTSGLSDWQTDDQGHRYRWTSGHASFFVPADARTVELTMKSVKDSPADWPIVATITIDDKPAQVLTFDDEAWRTVKLHLPPRGNRDVRRIDIKLDRLRARQRGLQLQPPTVQLPRPT